MTVLEEDRVFCTEILPKVSRTFALSIEMLPDDLRDAVKIAYLLCRIVDTIEDEPLLGIGDRHVLFDVFDRTMADDDVRVSLFEEAARTCGIGVGAERDLATRAGAAFREFRALSDVQRRLIRPHVLEMSQGMREYAVRTAKGRGLTLADTADLERYCYFVAGTVGNLLTDLFLATLPELPIGPQFALRERAVSFGLGLQLVNIVKDVAEDAERGVCFLPQAIADARGIALKDVLDPRVRPQALAMVADVCDLARTHLHKAVEYTLFWPAPQANAIRQFCAVPLALALATLQLVETSPDTLVRGKNPKISHATVAHLLQGTHRAVGDNAALAAVFAGATRPVPQP